MKWLMEKYNSRRLADWVFDALVFWAVFFWALWLIGFFK